MNTKKQALKKQGRRTQQAHRPKKRGQKPGLEHELPELRMTR
jgi:hypothetical protein